MPEIGEINLRLELTPERKAVYLVGEWPARTAFSQELLREADPECLHVAGEEVVITLANSTATYRRVCDAPYGGWICDKVERCLN